VRSFHRVVHVREGRAIDIAFQKRIDFTIGHCAKWAIAVEAGWLCGGLDQRHGAVIIPDGRGASSEGTEIAGTATHVSRCKRDTPSRPHEQYPAPRSLGGEDLPVSVLAHALACSPTMLATNKLVLLDRDCRCRAEKRFRKHEDDFALVQQDEANRGE